MQKIGILFGQERAFPQALIARINHIGEAVFTAEPVKIDKVIQGVGPGYVVIVDRISQDVPFYRSFLKNAALRSTAVLNNPFWWSADEKFFNNCLATAIGVHVPRTVLLPSSTLPPDTTDQSFLNLAWPLDWETMFRYVTFPAYMKPFAGGGWKHVYRLENKEDFYKHHPETRDLVMMLQEEIVFEEYYRCYSVGGKYVHIMPYDPRNAPHQRYQASFTPSLERIRQLEEIVLKINRYLGYDFNSVELAIRDGVAYAIDFCNPAPDADPHSVGEQNFEWMVEHSARYAIERAQSRKEGKDNLTWGQYLTRSIEQKELIT